MIGVGAWKPELRLKNLRVRAIGRSLMTPCHQPASVYFLEGVGGLLIDKIVATPVLDSFKKGEIYWYAWILPEISRQ